MFRAEIRSTINDLHVYRSIKSAVVPIERANQYAASRAEKALGNTTPLMILPAMPLVFDPNEQGSLRVRHIRGTVFAAKVAVAGSRIVCVRRAHKLQVNENVAAMTSSAHSVHDLAPQDLLLTLDDKKTRPSPSRRRKPERLSAPLRNRPCRELALKWIEHRNVETREITHIAGHHS